MKSLTLVDTALYLAAALLAGVAVMLCIVTVLIAIAGVYSLAKFNQNVKETAERQTNLYLQENLLKTVQDNYYLLAKNQKNDEIKEGDNDDNT